MEDVALTLESEEPAPDNPLLPSVRTRRFGLCAPAGASGTFSAASTVNFELCGTEEAAAPPPPSAAGPLPEPAPPPPPSAAAPLPEPAPSSPPPPGPSQATAASAVTWVTVAGGDCVATCASQGQVAVDSGGSGNALCLTEDPGTQYHEVGERAGCPLPCRASPTS